MILMYSYGFVFPIDSFRTPMDSHRILWIPMDSYRICMDAYAIPMDSFGFL